jgi:hypothetical protein
MDTLTGFALKRNIRVPKDVVDELVHGRFLESTAATIRPATERPGAFDLLRQEVRDVCEHVWSE